MIVDACRVPVVVLCAKKAVLLMGLDVLNDVLVLNVEKLDFGPFGNVENLRFGVFVAALWTCEAGNQMV